MTSIWKRLNEGIVYGESLEKRPWTLSGTVPEDRLLENAMKIRSRLIVLLAGGAVLALCRLVGVPVLDDRQADADCRQ
jgi:hypothetical protein